MMGGWCDHKWQVVAVLAVMAFTAILAFAVDPALGLHAVGLGIVAGACMATLLEVVGR